MSKHLLSLAIFALCGLAACAATGDIGAPSAKEPLDGAPATDSSSGAATEIADTPSFEEAAPPPPPSPESLVGLTSEELEVLLGTPAHTTQEPPAQIWRYSLDICKLFFFLYDSGDDGLPTVKHVDVAIADGVQIQPHLCLSGISLSGLPTEPVVEPIEETGADPAPTGDPAAKSD